MSTNWTPQTNTSTDYTPQATVTSNYGLKGMLYNELGRTYNAVEQSGNKKLYNGVTAGDFGITGKINTNWITT